MKKLRNIYQKNLQNMKVLYPNCSEWVTKISVFNLDELSKSEIKMLFDMMNKLSLHLRTNKEETKIEIENIDEDYLIKLKKLPFWDLVDYEEYIL